MNRDKTFTGLLSETFAVIGRNGAAIAVFVAVLGGIGTVGLMLGYLDEGRTLSSFGFGFNFDPADGLVPGLFQIGAAVFSIVAAYFLLARLLETDGRLPTRETRIWAYIGITVVSFIGMILGFLLLIVPGLIVLVRWSGSSGYLIERRKGIIDALGASWDATRGYSWPIFFVGLVLFLGLAMIGGVMTGVVAVVDSNLLAALFGSIAEAFGNAVMLAFGIAVYLTLEDDSDQISEVFA